MYKDLRLICYEYRCYCSSMYIFFENKLHAHYIALDRKKAFVFETFISVSLRTWDLAFLCITFKEKMCSFLTQCYKSYRAFHWVLHFTKRPVCMKYAKLGRWGRELAHVGVSFLHNFHTRMRYSRFDMTSNFARCMHLNSHPKQGHFVINCHKSENSTLKICW